MEYKYLLKVWMVTYNHERFIGQAIESVMMQKTNFSYLLVIGEDCSKDRTRDICMEYKEKYPTKIDLKLNVKNLGADKNALNIYDACFKDCKYVAMLEGDDYWTDLLKLQKQVDFMESNNNVSVCFHNSEIKYENDIRTNKLYINKGALKSELSMRDLLYIGPIPTASILFRNGYISEFPEWYKNLKLGRDVALVFLLLEHGLIKYIEDVMAVYRSHSNSLTHNSEIRKDFAILCIEAYSKIDKHFKYKYHDSFMIPLSKYYIDACCHCINKFDLINFIKFFIKAFDGIKYNDRLNYYNLLGTLIYPITSRLAIRK